VEQVRDAGGAGERGWCTGVLVPGAVPVSVEGVGAWEGVDAWEGEGVWCKPHLELWVGRWMPEGATSGGCRALPSCSSLRPTPVRQCTPRCLPSFPFRPPPSSPQLQLFFSRVQVGAALLCKWEPGEPMEALWSCDPASRPYQALPGGAAVSLPRGAPSVPPAGPPSVP